MRLGEFVRFVGMMLVDAMAITLVMLISGTVGFFIYVGFKMFFDLL